MEGALEVLAKVWGHKGAMAADALRLYRSEKETSARRYEEVWDCADSRRISMDALRAERDEARERVARAALHAESNIGSLRLEDEWIRQVAFLRGYK